ncbi:hypothetical protein JCM19298_847 [Nonlabens ulvanivorans]|nr:hypothetical protein JCM19298_847 [Nonlabens ulvanivorans]
MNLFIFKYRLRQAQTDILVLEIYYKGSGCHTFAKARLLQTLKIIKWL